MKIKKISIKWQLIIICILLVSVPVIVFGVISYNNSKNTITSQVEESMVQEALMSRRNLEAVYNIGLQKVKTNLQFAESIILVGFLSGRSVTIDEGDVRTLTITNQITKETRIATIPMMKLNNEPMLNNYQLIDQVKQTAGGTCTIFQLIPGGLLRISTNVMDDRGARAVGTYIPTDSPVYQAIIKGEEYYGRAFVVTGWYLAGYKPIKDVKGQVIGALYFGVNEKEVQEPLKEALSKTKIGSTGYIFILNKEGVYELSANRQRDGENVINIKDSGGNFVMKEMIDKAKALKEDEAGIMQYSWQNQGESEAKKKLAAFAYFPQWEWVISTSAYEDEFMEPVRRMESQTIIIIVIAIIIGSLAAYLFALNMSKRFKSLVDKINAVSMGDLTLKLAEGGEFQASRNEMDQLTNALGMMVDNLRGFVSKIVKSTETTAASAEELSASSEEVNAAMQQISTTIQEIANGAQILSKNSSDVSNKSRLAQESSRSGAKAGMTVKEKMTQIDSTNRLTAEKVKSLSDTSEKIGDIIETINSISEQTNLLALNAAIEAARAGDAGRGFAVVADEVRKLAEQSQKSTGTIRGLINGIQKEIGQAVLSMQENTKQVQEGSGSVNEALASFEEIPVIVEQLNKAISEISAISEENAAGSEEVSSSVEQVTSSMAQVSTAAQKLSKEADELKQVTKQFKVS